MRLEKNMKRIIVWLFILFFVLTTVISAPIIIKATINWGNAVHVNSVGQVVDSISINGKVVDALYAPRGSVANYDSDPTYSCAAFVKRFYSAIYGVEVKNLYPGLQPLISFGGGSFSRVATPKVGDIAGSNEHWAIVKSVSGNSVTLIEQNVWNTAYTSAMVGRILNSEGSYWFWRWSGNNITDTTAPTVSNVKVTDVTNESYTVTCTVNDNIGVSSVQFPSWNSDIHTGDDAVWLAGNINGNTASVTVKLSDLKSGVREGRYTTHIYAYDAAGNHAFGWVDVYIDRTPPVISHAQITNITETGYMVECTVTDNVAVDRVQFPTWTTANGQDDLVSDWWVNEKVRGERSGNTHTYTFYVDYLEHNKETGPYRTHIYAYDACGNSVLYDMLADKMLASDLSFTNEYKITFDAVGGNLNFYEDKTVQHKLASYPRPAYAGHIFDGWYTSKDGGTKVSADTVFDRDTTLYAHWMKRTGMEYTITFDANGGACSTTTLQTAGNKLTGLPTAARSGYTFKGWYTLATGGIAADTSTEFHADTTLYAQWEANTAASTGTEYTVTFDANGGTCSTTTLQTIGNKLTTLPRPTRNGYTFKGWYTMLTDGTNITTSTVFNKDIIVYAQWSVNAASSGFTSVIVSSVTSISAKVTAKMPLQYVKSWWILYGSDKNNMKSTSILYPAKKCDSLTFNYFNYELSSDSLVPDTVYYVQFCFINEEGTTVKSDIQSFKTLASNSGKRGIVSNPTVTAPNIISIYADSLKIGKLNISFNAAGKASGYQIQYSKNKKFSSSVVTKTIRSTSTHLNKTYSGLKKGKKYYVRVRSYVNSDGKIVYGTWSKKLSVKLLKK